MNLNAPPSRVVTGTIKRTSDDTCFVEGEWGQGRLRQEYSRFRDSLEPLERLPDYQPGCQLQVYLANQPNNDGLWHLNERWAHKNPWSDLKLSPGDAVKGTVARGVSGGYFVQLDDPDIEVWLPDREVPWADGSLREEPYTQGLARFILEADDRIQALITHIHVPPQYPAISLRRYLENLERQSDESSVVPPSPADPSLELRFRARITGDLGSLRRRLAAGQPLAGKRLLVVDDDPATLDAMVLLLKHNGAQVDTVQVERSLSEAVEAIQAALRSTNLALILIDYSLPGRGEGVRLASRVRSLQPQTPPIILYSGYRLDTHQVEELRAAGVDGVMRKPLRLDGLLTCLQGQTVWEVDAALSSTGKGTHDLLPPPGASPAELLAEFYRLGQLSYAVLLEVTAPHRLEMVLCCGKFPSDPKTLESLLLVTDLRNIIRGLRRGLRISSAHSLANEGLRPYSRYARFLALGGSEKPRYILGLGWEARNPPFTDLELRAYALLLEARLEQQDTWRWMRDQLPFLTQGQLLISLSHEIRARFSPWLNYQQALRAVWRRYPTAERDEERRALEADIEQGLRGMKKAYNGLHELLELMLSGLHQRKPVCRLRPLLEQLRELFWSDLKQHGIRLDIAEAPDLTLGLSPLYLLQPLSNLILNSRKHMHKPMGGRVKVTTDIGGGPPDTGQQWLVVDVEDNGPGIPAHIVLHIFKPGYSRAPRAEERTGMGLYVSRLLARWAGGDLEMAENWRGLGCRFRLRLPLVLGER